MVSARDLPPNSFGFFLGSMTQASVFPVPNSQGVLCLGGSILNSGASGAIYGVVNLNAMPQPTGAVTVQPGVTWHFQAWHRDANPSVTSNFTDAVYVTFE